MSQERALIAAELIGCVLSAVGIGLTTRELAQVCGLSMRVCIVATPIARAHGYAHVVGSSHWFRWFGAEHAPIERARKSAIRKQKRAEYFKGYRQTLLEKRRGVVCNMDAPIIMRVVDASQVMPLGRVGPPSVWDLADCTP